MIATRDLIAAALRLTAIAERNTDDRDEWQHSISEVREMCARAMVQPDMAEVERLVREFEYAAGPYGHDLVGVCGSRFATRAALLDYVRGVMAERDALMQTLRDEIGENLRLRELGGALPDENITAMTERLIRERDQFRDAAKMVPVGWTLVPIEPTRGMLDAYVKNGARFNSARSDWAAMLALCDEMSEALNALLFLINRDAPQLSGKTIGYAQTALAKWKEPRNDRNTRPDRRSAKTDCDRGTKYR